MRSISNNQSSLLSVLIPPPSLNSMNREIEENFFNFRKITAHKRKGNSLDYEDEQNISLCSDTHEVIYLNLAFV